MAEEKVHSVADNSVYAKDVWETNYPYIVLKDGALNRTLGNIRRSIAPFNPFASNQVPSQERMAIGLRWGNGWFNPDPYPNGVHFEKLFPTHYDPLKSSNFEPTSYLTQSHAPGLFADYVLTSDKLPKGCVRSIQGFRRCVMVNGEQKCADEATDIARICPNWALDTIKEKNRFLMKVRAIQNDQYRRAMVVPEYNKGRSISDVPDKTWIDGTRTFLRPDTMWADERYAKITQAEINEAKQRVKDRAQKNVKHDAHHGEDAHAHGEEHAHGEHHHNPAQVTIQTPKRLYP